MNTIKISFIMLLLVLSSSIYRAAAQAPQKFNYQGIARDAKGNPLGNRQMSLKLSILPAQDAAVAEYEETQMVSTNDFGLYTLQIGNGTVLNGDMKNVKWETGNKYIKVGIDANGGNDYTDMGTTQLLSVPYAIYADKAGVAREAGSNNGGTRAGGVVTAPATTGDLNMVPKFNGTANTITNSNIYDNGTNVGIGTTTPSSALHIKRPTTAYFALQSDADNSTAAIRLQDMNGTAGELGISKFGTNTAGTFMGVSRKGMGVINNLTGPFLFNVGGYCLFGQTVGVSQIVRMMIDSTTGNVGIGTTIANPPTQKLDVTGQIRMRGGSPGAGKIMTSSADGTASWSTIAGAGILVGSGNNHYMTKFTPNGTSLGSSAMFDSAGYIRANAANGAFNNNSALYFKAPQSKRNLFTFENRGTVNTGFLNTYMAIMDSLRFDATSSNYKALILGHSQKINNGTFGDSIAGVTLNPYNKLHVGGFQTQGLVFNLQNGRMSNGTIFDVATASNAHFSINSSFDTAGYFSSTTNVTSADGILRGEYLGANVSDHVGVFGRSVPGTDFYGIGVVGEGGYYGVKATSNISTGGGNKGVYATANSNAEAVGMYGHASYTSINNVGDKIGVHGSADGGNTAIGVEGYATGGNTNYGVYASAPVGGANRAGLFNGDLQVIGNLSKSGGTFKIDHPNDPENKYLIHSFVESPEMMNIYNGNIVTDANGDAVVTMPDYFKSLNTDFRYQLTVIGTFAQAIVAEKMSGNTFKIKTSQPNVEVSWMVTGVRKDPYALAHPIVPEMEKEANFKGKYLNPAEYGQPASKGIYSSQDLQRAEAEKQSKAIHEKTNSPKRAATSESKPVANPALSPFGND